ncbi:NADH:flavin oxidoreductase [Paenibacillus sacheonensis]|uniref:12-oxophytodienoate reductase n=1 Tax=Paenibacillus sacheonensis TaxID=742054 RepID=A0A7X4YTT5_9BACL|nr:NADH:flavin oxidoreductase [Paenibacillus sacheonensis]MBM7568667.1 2,4-dienoyl-CoA reductase-like NADH-dependent reductase (Old Yellow Enzyme family) [Paenibacillus sacheonensis]NBC72442.1 12-oxophytodienoate reductase [Paenibacillus sacheonensis]
MSTNSAKALFEPFRSAKLSLDNRIVMAPMTRGFSPGGVPSEDVAAYYKRRAENGVGLIVTEGTLINHPAAGASTRWPHFYGANALNGWSGVVNAVHGAGGKIMPQLWHLGITRKPGTGTNPDAPSVGPSGLNLAGEQVGEPLTEAEIADLIAAYAQAAADAKRLGFDGIELHGAHGYLIDQFFWGVTNTRTDRFGGGLVKRTRFAAEVVEACRRAVGPDFPIMLRFSQWKDGAYDARLAKDADELALFLQPLTDAGVDVFHCSTRRFWEPAFDDGVDLNLAAWTKKLTGKPTITVGSVGLDLEFTRFFKEKKGAGITGIEELLERLDRGEFDLVAIGRALLGDPAWAAKIKEGRESELRPFTPEATQTLY